MELTSLKNSSAIPSRISNVGAKVSRSMRALASGEYITRAADDVAGMSVATGLFSRVSALRSASINIAQAASLLQVADGGLQDISDILLRMQSLSVMANSGTIHASERGFLDLEFQQLKESIDRIANETNFNGVKVLNGDTIEVEETVTPTGPGDTITGSGGNEYLVGTAGDDEIQSLAGDDSIDGGFGDDLILPGVDILPGIQGQIYIAGGGIGNLAQAEAVVAGAAAPDATFTSTGLDYPQGAPNSQSGPLNNFLGADGASIDNPALLPLNTNQMVFVFEGFVQVAADGVYNFSIGTDDGFDLSIDGASVLQFPNNRGFSFTNGNVPLTAGTHAIRFLFWENGGSEGMEVFSGLTGGGILDDSVLTFSPASTDGNDIVNGEEGTDIAVFEGNIADYTITKIADNQFQVTDNRMNTPNGTDQLINVEIARFADGDVTLIGDEEVEEVEAGPQRRTLSFIVSEDSADQFSYEVVDATLDALFDAPDDVSITTQDGAALAFDAVREAVNRTTELRAYVGSLQSESGFISDTVITRLRTQDNARAVIEDTDIARVSTRLVLELVQRNTSVAVSAQTNALREENINDMMEGIAVEPTS